MHEPKTQTIDEAAKELGIGRNQAYAAAKRGEVPTIKTARAPQKDARTKRRDWPTIAEEQKRTSQHLETTSDLKAPKRPPHPSRFRFEQVNDVTWKLTITETPASHGQWGDYRTTKALAWVICVAPGKWLARYGDMVCGPLSLPNAKAAAMAMAKGRLGDYQVRNPISHLNGLQARLLGTDESSADD